MATAVKEQKHACDLESNLVSVVFTHDELWDGVVEWLNEMKAEEITSKVGCGEDAGSGM